MAKKLNRLVIAFIFTEKHGTLSSIELHHSTRANRLLVKLNKMNIDSGGISKFRIVKFSVSQISREDTENSLEAIENFFWNHYKKKRYDSKRYWWKSITLENLMIHQESDFADIIKGIKRYKNIDKLLK